MHAVAISGFDVNMSCKKLSLQILQIELALRLRTLRKILPIPEICLSLH